jgi:hypothetical protein
MGIFNRTVNKAAISPQPTKAAAVGGTFYQNNNAGSQLVGQYYSYVEGTARNRAMSVPTISRARDLMASVIGCMNLKMYTEMWNGEEMEKMPLAPRTWLRRIDPSVPNNFLLAWLFDDLIFLAEAFLTSLAERLTAIHHRLLDCLQQWCKHLIRLAQFGLHRLKTLCLTAAV